LCSEPRKVAYIRLAHVASKTHMNASSEMNFKPRRPLLQVRQIISISLGIIVGCHPAMVRNQAASNGHKKSCSWKAEECKL